MVVPRAAHARELSSTTTRMPEAPSLVARVGGDVAAPARAAPPYRPLLVLIAAAIRLADRFTHGRPPLDADEPQWAAMLARMTHVLLYALLFAMPILGLTAWFTGNDAIAGYHAFLWNPLLAVIALHVLGALTQHFWFRSPALKRMIPGIRHSA
mgnify:CR=1 FL=1